MQALDPEVIGAVWEACKALIPVKADDGPLGSRRQRIPDCICFYGMLVRLGTGCSWEDTERLLGYQVSDTTLRARRDEWIKAGVFERLAIEALAAYARIIGLDLTDVLVDTSLHKAPCGGPGTGRNPTDRGKLGIKWSIMTDRNGIPFAWVINGANRHDIILFGPTLQAAEERGFLPYVGTLHLDRGYDSSAVLDLCRSYGITDVDCAKKRPRSTTRQAPARAPLGIRWIVERTHSWLSNYGQLCRNTDRRPQHRQAQLSLAIAFIITAKLVKHSNRQHLKQPKKSGGLIWGPSWPKDLTAPRWSKGPMPWELDDRNRRGVPSL